MKILVLGNIASGKSTMIGQMKHILQGYEVIAIDDFRIRYGDGSMEAEIISKQMFIDSITEHKNQIIEAMGTGDTGIKIFEKLSRFKEHVITVILRTPLEICIERLKKRESRIPYPAPPERAYVLAKKTDEQIASGALLAFWKKLDQCTVYEATELEEIKDIIINMKK